MISDSVEDAFSAGRQILKQCGVSGSGLGNSFGNTTLTLQRAN